MLRALHVSGWVVIGLCAVCPLSGAQPRATDEQLDEGTLPLDEDLKDVRKNYAAIEARILKRGKGDTDELVERFERERKKSGNPADKAVYSYLLARTWYWHAFHRFKSTRSRDVFSSLRPRVLEEYLRAFEHVQKSGGLGGRAAPIGKQIVDTFVAALGTSIWGASLSQEQKSRVVDEFLIVLENSPAGRDLLAANPATPLMYRNMGRPLDPELIVPGDLPEDYEGLKKVLDGYRRGAPPAVFLPVLEAIEKKHAVELAKDPTTLGKMAGIYVSAGRLKQGYRLFSQAAEAHTRWHPRAHTRYYLPLYLLSLRHKDELQEDNPRRFLEKYLSGARPVGAEKKPGEYTRAEAYKRAADALMEAGFYTECRHVVERCGDDGAAGLSFAASTRLAYYKARCLEETGEKVKAIAEYRRLLKAIEGKPDVDIDRRNCERRLKRLTE